ncbi:hypothetical protein [Paenibacillus periandrae]|uniref:hypothetical protein n=1 Tax=Paenibacillus periandrae TaxID=1761741 RepID=UPI001F09A6D6|nr:hypothetical protein [Paenibacillus periandrae]
MGKCTYKTTGNDVKVTGPDINGQTTQVTDNSITWSVKNSETQYVLTNSPVTTSGFGQTTTVTVSKGTALRLGNPTLAVVGTMKDGISKQLGR